MAKRIGTRVCEIQEERTRSGEKIILYRNHKEKKYMKKKKEKIKTCRYSRYVAIREFEICA